MDVVNHYTFSLSIILIDLFYDDFMVQWYKSSDIVVMISFFFKGSEVGANGRILKHYKIFVL